MSFSAKEKLIWCCKKMRWGKHSLKVTLFEQKRFNDMGHLAKREKQKVDTAQAIIKIIKVKTFVNDQLVRSTNWGYYGNIKQHKTAIRPSRPLFKILKHQKTLLY